MAEKKITRKEALEAAIYLVKLAADETINTDNAANWSEVAEALEKMHTQVTKPRTRKPNTAKRDANVALGKKFVELWKGDTFKAADVANLLEVSKAKATAICKAMSWNEVPSTEKVKVYCL